MRGWMFLMRVMMIKQPKSTLNFSCLKEDNRKTATLVVHRCTNKVMSSEMFI